MIHWGVSLELAQIPLHSSSYRLFRDTRRTPNRKWTARCRVFNIQIIQSQRQHFEILTLIFWPKRKCFINVLPCPCPRLFKSKKIQDSFRIRIDQCISVYLQRLDFCVQCRILLRLAWRHGGRILWKDLGRRSMPLHRPRSATHFFWDSSLGPLKAFS